MSPSTNFKTAVQAAWLAALLLANPLPAQEFRGTITGSVTDPSGAAVPGVRVEARNIDTSAVTPATTNQSGIYTIPFLVPGTYTLTASSHRI